MISGVALCPLRRISLSVFALAGDRAKPPLLKEEARDADCHVAALLAMTGIGRQQRFDLTGAYDGSKGSGLPHQ